MNFRDRPALEYRRGRDGGEMVNNRKSVVEDDKLKQFSREHSTETSGVELCDNDREAAVLVEDFEETGRGASDGDDNPMTLRTIDNYHLESRGRAVSIMQLPLCIDDDVVWEGEGGKMQDIYLFGRTEKGTREIRVLAEKWELRLHPDREPRFLVKTATDWVWAQRPKPVFRTAMSDGLTLAHFLHFVKKHPCASAHTVKEYLTIEFGMFGERPSLETLSGFFPIIERYVEVDLAVLREFFPHHFGDVETADTVSEVTRQAWPGEELSCKGISIDLNIDISDGAEDQEMQGAECTSGLKARKPQQSRTNVQAELRKLHSKWCKSLGDRSTGKGNTKRVSQARPSKETASKKTSISKMKHPSKKTAAKKICSAIIVRPSENQSLELVAVPTLESRASALEVLKESRMKKMLETEELQNPEVSTANFKRQKTLVKESTTVSERSDHVPGLRGRGVYSSLQILASVPPSESRISALERLKILRTKEMVVETEDVQNSQVNPASFKQQKTLAKAPTKVSEKSDHVLGLRGRGVHSPLNESVAHRIDPPICAICDDGGNLICCEGPCLRNFHATAAADICCPTLGLTGEQVKQIGNYYCKNCLQRQHQCFICEELGSSAPSSLRPQEAFLRPVYQCDALGCRKFYHSSCVSKALCPGELDWKALADRIDRGLHGFFCPRHACAVCESQEVQPGYFVQCRRCPRAWHRDCLTEFSSSRELPTISIWKHYNREFVYCRRHEILPGIQAPRQDHIRFPAY